MNEQELRLRFQDRAILRFGETYYDFPTARSFLSACKKNQMAAIGIEGFEIEGNDLTPKMDLIADLSAVTATNWVDYCNRVNNAADNFLDAVENQSSLFSIVVIDAAEWKQSGT